MLAYFLLRSSIDRYIYIVYHNHCLSFLSKETGVAVKNQGVQLGFTEIWTVYDHAGLPVCSWYDLHI